MLRESIRTANNIRNGHKSSNGRRPQGQNRPGRNRSEPTEPTHGELLRAEIPSLDIDPALTQQLHAIADQLATIEKPRATTLQTSCRPPHTLVLIWENTQRQHCITLTVDLRNMGSYYEYSMVCDADDEMLPFPKKPLGSTLTERIDLDLSRTAHWTWIKHRVEATRNANRE